MPNDEPTITQVVCEVGGTGIMLLAMVAQLFSVPYPRWGLLVAFLGGAMVAYIGMYRVQGSL